MLAVRRHKTAVYNIDPDRFEERLAATLTELGLDFSKHSRRLVIAPAGAFVPVETVTTEPGRVSGPTKTLRGPPGGPLYAELTVDAVPMFCHITLHWDSYTPEVRREIEEHLARALEGASPAENPVAGWFLGFSGLIFFTITMLAAVFIVFFVWRR
jgi:hypothetical protein